MKVAVVTPFYRTPREWLAQCLDSVARQTFPCTHFVACDGDDSFDFTPYPNVRVLRLPGPHQDMGNAARAIGTISAIGHGHDGVEVGDADNWFESDHLRMLADEHACCVTNEEFFKKKA